MSSERPIVILCLLCCTPIFASYLIAAIIIGFMSNDKCLDQTEIIIDPFLYLKIGGISFLGLDLFTLCTRFTICKKRSTEYDFTPSKGQSCISFIGVLFEISWIIIGCLLYNHLNNQCISSSVGSMLLSFIIISSIFNCIECISISQSCLNNNNNTLLLINENDNRYNEYQSILEEV